MVYVLVQCTVNSIYSPGSPSQSGAVSFSARSLAGSLSTSLVLRPAGPVAPVAPVSPRRPGKP